MLKIVGYAVVGYVAVKTTKFVVEKINTWRHKTSG